MAAERPVDILRRAERTACPAVMRGLNSNWPGLSRWEGLEGLSYLTKAAGQATVQAMVAPSSNFFGNIEQHTSVACTLGQLLDIAAQQQQQQQMLGSHHAATSADAPAAAAAATAAPHGGGKDSLQGLSSLNLYLAQQSLQDAGLSGLLDDVPIPDVLHDKQLTAINLWFSSRCGRSSTHYDPYQNLLCVITGSKRLRLFSPAAGLGLYPRALGGEASNHSSVNFAEPDLEQHPLYKHAVSQALDVVLHPGDALFIPEGWWHQVDSEDMTFAVNFWWSSDITTHIRSMPHQHHYYLRQLMAATSSEAVELLISGIPPWTWSPKATAPAAAAAHMASSAARHGSAEVQVGDASPNRKRRRVDTRHAVEPSPGIHHSTVEAEPPTAAVPAAAGGGGSHYPAAANMPQGSEAPAAITKPHTGSDVAGDSPSEGGAIHVSNGSCPNGSASSDADSSSGETGGSSSSSRGSDVVPADLLIPGAQVVVEVETSDVVVQLTDYEQAALQELVDAIRSEIRPSPLPAAATDEDAAAAAAAPAEGVAGVCQQQQWQQQGRRQQQQQLGMEATTEASLADRESLQQAQPAQDDRQGRPAAAGAVAAASNRATTSDSYAGAEHRSAAAAAAAVAAAEVVNGILTSEQWWKMQETAQQQLLLTAVGQVHGDWPASTAAQVSLAAATADNAGNSAEQQHLHCTGRAGRYGASAEDLPSKVEAANSKDLSGGDKLENHSAAAAGAGSLGLCSRVGRLVAGLNPYQLMRILWVAAGGSDIGGCADAVQLLLLHGLTPAVAYMLPLKFEAADLLFADNSNHTDGVDAAASPRFTADAKEQDTVVKLHPRDGPDCRDAGSVCLQFSREAFYARLYGTVLHPDAVLHNLVQGKAEFALAAAELITRCHMSVWTSGKQ